MPSEHGPRFVAAAERADLDVAVAKVLENFPGSEVLPFDPAPDGQSALSVPAPEFLARSESEDEVAWTVEELLTAEAVAFFGGEPKTLKSWTAADCALAVAAGVPALGRFRPALTGHVLVVQEESRSADFARRLRWLARGHDLEPEALGDLHIASQPGLLIDEPAGQERLVDEILRLAPRLVVLDPLVRMHSADEDRSREMRPILRFIRRLQAEHGCAIVVIHHMRKAGEGPRQRPGQRLRGTGDLHALLDSALYFDVRAGVELVAVSVEHREAPPPDPFTLRLDVDPEAGTARLRAEAGTLEDLAVLEAMPEVEAALRPEGQTTRELEEAVSRRAQVVREALKRLEAAGRAISEAGARPDALGRSRKVTLWSRR